MSGHKICSKCKEEKDLNKFYKDKRYKDTRYPSCIECCKLKHNNWTSLNREKVRANSRNTRLRHIEKYNNIQKLYYLKHKEEIIKKNSIYLTKQLKTNKNLKISRSLRRRLNNALKKNFKSGSAVRDLGCSISELKLHLEAMFYPNPETGEMMTWDNYGFYGWHIDHIRALSSFDLNNREELLRACHYTNLQPLWAKDNLSKGHKQPLTGVKY